jgi:hypothetical protein
MPEILSELRNYTEVLLRREFTARDLDNPLRLQEIINVVRAEFDCRIATLEKERANAAWRGAARFRHAPLDSAGHWRVFEPHLKRMIATARQQGSQASAAFTDRRHEADSSTAPAPAETQGPQAPAELRAARRMTVEQANANAKKLAKQYQNAFFAMSKRQQAELIGCHYQTWEQTDLYKSAVKKGRIPAPQPRVPKTVSLTNNLEAATGEGEKDETQKKAAEHELRRLRAEQAGDHEPSPLSDDPPGRERKVHFRKRP